MTMMRIVLIIIIIIIYTSSEAEKENKIKWEVDTHTHANTSFFLFRLFREKGARSVQCKEKKKKIKPKQKDGIYMRFVILSTCTSLRYFPKSITETRDGDEDARYHHHCRRPGAPEKQHMAHQPPSFNI